MSRQSHMRSSVADRLTVASEIGRLPGVVPLSLAWITDEGC